MPRGIDWSIGEVTRWGAVTSGYFDSTYDEVESIALPASSPDAVRGAGRAYADAVQERLPERWHVHSDGQVTGPRKAKRSALKKVRAARDAVDLDAILDEFGLR